MRAVVTGLTALAVLLGSLQARAQCRENSDCAAELICEVGRCVVPPPTASLPAASPAAPTSPRTKVQSPALIAGGIATVLLGAFVLSSTLWVGAGEAACGLANAPEDQYRCDSGGLAAGLAVSGLVLIGAGIPMIVVGSQKKPISAAPRAQIQPWFAARGAGVHVRLAL
jgi:hypothetical protein